MSKTFRGVCALLGAVALAVGLLGNLTSAAASPKPTPPRITVERQTSTLPNGSEGDLLVSCLRGEVATGGGGAVGLGGIPGAYLTASGPLPTTVTQNPTAWHVVATNTSGATEPLTVWVLCAG